MSAKKMILSMLSCYLSVASQTSLKIRVPQEYSLHLFSTKLLDEAKQSISSLERDIAFNSSLLSEQDAALAKSMLQAELSDMARANQRLDRAISRSTDGARHTRDIPSFFGLASASHVDDIAFRMKTEAAKAQLQHEALLSFESKVKASLKNLNYEVAKQQRGAIDGLRKTTIGTVISQRLIDHIMHAKMLTDRILQLADSIESGRLASNFLDDPVTQVGVIVAIQIATNRLILHVLLIQYQTLTRPVTLIEGGKCCALSLNELYTTIPCIENTRLPYNQNFKSTAQHRCLNHITTELAASDGANCTRTSRSNFPVSCKKEESQFGFNIKIKEMSPEDLEESSLAVPDGELAADWIKPLSPMKMIFFENNDQHTNIKPIISHPLVSIPLGLAVLGYILTVSSLIWFIRKLHQRVIICESSIGLKTTGKFIFHFLFF